MIDMLKRLAKEKEILRSASFWWDTFKRFMKEQAGVDDWKDAVKDQSIRVHLASEWCRVMRVVAGEVLFNVHAAVRQAS